MVRLLAVMIGYVFGLFPSAIICGKLHHKDITKEGSGNTGATNVVRAMGAKAGFLVFLGDCLKCILAIVLVRSLFGESHEDMIQLLCLYAGAGAILGHDFPFYKKFKGGKGISATAGMVIAFDPLFALVGVVMFFSIYFLTFFVSLGSMMTYLFLLILLVICGQLGYFPDMSQAALIEAYVLFALLTALAFWSHRSNIKRLRDGIERQTKLKNKVD